MASVLEGIKVLDFTQVYSGPFCTLNLRNFGAEIIKVERPGSGDLTRNDWPHTEGHEGGNYIILNRGKQSLTIDLKSEKGRAIIKDLVKQVDVLVENFSPGTMDKLGLGSKEMCDLNPKLIYASISAYGQTGPYRDYPGFDPVSQAMGGMTAVTGFPEEPVRCGVSIADLSSGLFAATAIMAAIIHRMKTGEGQVIDISMQEAIWTLTSVEFAGYYFLAHQEPPRLGNGHAAMIPCNVYKTKDGGLFIAAGVLDQVRRLYRAMGREDLIDSPLGGNQNLRIQHREEINEAISAWTQGLTTAEVMEQLQAADVPCSRVPSFGEVCNDEQLLSRNAIVEIEQDVSGPVKVPGSIFKMSRTPGNITYPAPFLGQHNVDILAGMLGYSEADINRLADEGVI
jgi:CoA:oxalate CoA-transferase